MTSLNWSKKRCRLLFFFSVSYTHLIPKIKEDTEESRLKKLASEMYINFLNEPEIAAANIEYIQYSTPNDAALALLDEETRNNPVIYPSDDKLEDVYKRQVQRKLHCLRVDVASPCAEGGIAADEVKGALAFLLPDRGGQPVPFFSREAAAQSRSDAHGVHGSFNQQGAGATERVIQLGVWIDMSLSLIHI